MFIVRSQRISFWKVGAATAIAGKRKLSFLEFQHEYRLDAQAQDFKLAYDGYCKGFNYVKDTK